MTLCPVPLPKVPPESRLAFHIRRLRLHLRFRKKMGCWGSFENPRTYQEKLQFRKLYGHHAFYAMAADKHRVRDYVAAKVGARYLIPQLAAHARLTPEVFAPLPERFIMKANHGCKWHLIVRDKAALDIPATVSRFNGYLGRTYGARNGEHHYRFIPPLVVFEELLDDGGRPPADYCFYCYHGRRGFDFAVSVALPGTHTTLHCDKDWNVWDGEFPPEEAKRLVSPPNFPEMVEVAEALSRDFDFVRVDLYNVGGRIYFGELTCTPAAGLGPIENLFRAARRDEMWELAADNPLLYRRPGK